MVHRRLDDDAVALAGEEVDCQGHTLDYSGHECEFLAAHVESVTPLQPSGYRLPVAVGGLEIAEYGVVETGAQGVDYFGAHGEIHVGNP